MDAFELATKDWLWRGLMTSGPVHHPENVPDDPTRLRSMCGRFSWIETSSEMLDPSWRDNHQLHEVTCPECLAAMADVPSVVEATR